MASWTSFRYLLFLLWMSIVFSACLFLFTGGFLLRRNTLSQKSQCSQEGGSQNCHAPSRPPLFKKAVVLIIDALKHEFADYDENNSKDEHYLNKLPVLRDLEKKGYGRLYEFLADPPTTTMQRLKGLTTGSLPTFIDASSNFGSYAIEEDNIIDQMITGGGKRVVFAGDDTWEGLYPRRFARSFPFPSFDVWDLDTVDRGVTKHLFAELNATSEWDVIIGHYLGVDHAGHKFGPRHPEMTRKLTEMDGVIRRVSEALPEDAVLFVMGDHGMTMSGDHGGDSRDELSAALFVHAKQYDFSSDKIRNEKKRSVEQVDFVPTFSLLMGIPIPFSNLGKLIPDLFVNNIGSPVQNGKDQTDIAPYLNANVEQVMTYLESYRLQGGNLPMNAYLALRRKFDALRSYKKDSNPKDGLQLLSDAKYMCASVWAEFDLNIMGAGLTLLFLQLTLLLLLGLTPRNRLLTGILNAKFIFQLWMSGVIGVLGGISLLLSERVNLDKGLTVVVTSALILTISVFGLNLLWKLIESIGDMAGEVVSSMTSPSALVHFGLGSALCLGLFSNSFVVDEALLLNFVIMTSLVTFVCDVRRKRKRPAVIVTKTNGVHANGNGTAKKHKSVRMPEEEEDEKESDNSQNTTTVIIAVVLAMGVLRLSSMYFRCREEQSGYCNPTELHKPIGTLSKDVSYREYKNRRFLSTLVGVACATLGPQLWLQTSGNLNGISLTVYMASYMPPVAGVSMVFYWAMQGHEVGSRLVPWQMNILAQAVFVICLSTVALTLLMPRMLFRVSAGEMPSTVMDREAGVHGVFQFMRSNWKNHFGAAAAASAQSTAGGKKINVFGLGTGLSAPITLIATMLVLLSMLILGDGLCPSLLLAMVAAVIFLYLSTHARIRTMIRLSDLFSVPWSAVMGWWFLESLFFYATAHQPTFPSIQWSAAFTGFSGSDYGGDNGGILGFLLPVVLVGWNTFVSRILFGITLPLLLTAPFTLWLRFPSLRRNLPNEEGRTLKTSDLEQGEVVLIEHVEETRSQLFKLCVRYLHLQAVRLLCAMLASAVLRRHLMVWKIFAPRFIFEGVGFLVSVTAVTLGYCVMVRIHNELVSYYRKLEKNK